MLEKAALSQAVALHHRCLYGMPTRLPLPLCTYQGDTTKDKNSRTMRSILKQNMKFKLLLAIIIENNRCIFSHTRNGHN